MLKKACISFSLITTMISFGQTSTLLKNVNYRAKELKQSLSKNGDSLILEGERRIYSVEIFNQNFEKTINIASNQAKIPLNDTPLGRLVVQAKLIDKRILITLLRHEEINKTSKKSKLNILNNALVSKSISKVQTDKNKIVSNLTEPIIYYYQIKTKETNTIASSVIENTSMNPDFVHKKSVLTDRHAQLLSKKPDNTSNTPNTYYWVKYKINTGNASRKSMRMENQHVVDKLISKHKLEIKTLEGKHNELTIWKINNRVKFMKLQIANPDYINSSSSAFFNVIPYYEL